MVKNTRTPETDYLCDAVLTLKNREEVYQFLNDVCTVNEIQSMAQRFTVAKYLMENMKYAEIKEVSGASTATVSRVNRTLLYGEDGYALAVNRLKERGITGPGEG
jgi:TrpR-related protein YerC/YecD